VPLANRSADGRVRRARRGTGLALVVTSLLALPSALRAQVTTIASADSVDGRPRTSLAIGGWLKLHGVYDFSGTPFTWALSPPSIPVGDVDVDPQFHLDMYQSRIKLRSLHQPVGFPLLTAYVEGDFFGNGGGQLRMRHAWLAIGDLDSGASFLAGHTWSTFGDPDAWPNITDFDGPPTGVWVRQGQLRYQRHVGERGRLQFALETPRADFERSQLVDSTLAAVNQNVPEITANYRLAFGRGHVQVGGIVRHVRYLNEVDDAKAYFRGWGLSLSSVTRLTDAGDNLTLQVLGGAGVSRYMIGFSGLGLDAIPDLNGALEPAPTIGGYVGYQHFWTAEWSSTVVGGYANITNDVLTGAGDIFEGGYGSANVFWNPLAPLNFGAEFLYGTNTSVTLAQPLGETGRGGRFQFVMEYAF
jgi:hypothetical protein